jgi:hypothetical protein
MSRFGVILLFSPGDLSLNAVADQNAARESCPLRLLTEAIAGLGPGNAKVCFSAAGIVK